MKSGSRMKLTHKCPICAKNLVLDKEINLGSSKLNQYKCGHIFNRDITRIDPAALNFQAADGSGKSARLYQKDGVVKIIESDFNQIIGDQMRLGKALVNGSIVFTPNGNTPIEQLTIGDFVNTPDGSVSKVIGVYPQGLRESYEVTFSDNTTIQCDGEHLWQVTTPDRKFRNAPELLLTLSKINERYKQANGNLKYYIPISEPVFFESTEVPIDPYILGILLGDGHLSGHGSSISFSSEDSEIINAVATYYPIKYKSQYDYRINDNSLWLALVNLGLYNTRSNNKLIPACYLINSIETRTAILQGLLDTDGYVSREGTVQFTSVSLALVTGVKFICESLGCVVRQTEKIPNYTYKEELKEGQLAYTLTINLPIGLKPFRLTRKLAKLSTNRKFLPSRGFKNIQPIGLKECTCIKIDDPIGLFLTNNFIITHNTPQALLALKNSYQERTPALILVRSANLWQWVREYKVWCDTLPNGIFPVISTTAWIPSGFSSYIISMDTFGANAKCKCGHRYHEKDCKGNGKACNCKVYQSDGAGIRDKLKKIPFKLVIVDEAHSFKNTDSNRSQALVDFVSHLNNGESDLTLKFECGTCKHEWAETGKIKFDKRIGHKVTSKSTRCPKCNQWCYIQQQAAEKVVSSEDKPSGLLLLTGTIIKNRADEFAIPLNLVAPEIFHSITALQSSWLTQDNKGRYTRVKPYLLDQFKRTIEPYYLRREKEDVFTDLPPLNRIFTVIEPEKDSFTKLYNGILDKLEAKLADKANPSYWDFAEDLMELRRICGLMKLSWIVDYLEINLLDSENIKFAVGLHHQTIRDILFHKLGGSQNCWVFSGSESIDRKNYIETNYTTMPQRVGILNMLAGGVGCDFHEIDNVIILERQWNSADETQFEFRFYNPDLTIKKRSTNIEYIIAKGTLDEWWYDMIEEKRKIFNETIGTNFDVTQDSASFRQLVEKTLSGRL